jgi:two-component system, cell cycle sensor histidine kinase and response regulator CckA
MTVPALLRGPFGTQPRCWLQPGSDTTGTASRSPATILVVDDEGWVRHLTARILRDAGHTVLEASSAEEALNSLEAAREVALVLADVVMPGMGGVQLADAIHERYPDQRVILMSAYAGELAKAGVRGAPLPILTKPFTAAQLTQKIDETLRRH